MDAGYAYNYAGTPSAETEELLVLFNFVVTLGILALLVVFVIAYWKIYAKAGEPGWGSWVPIYKSYLLFKIAWGNGWLFLLLLVPIVNIVVAFVTLYKLCKAFGYGVGFFLGMLFLAPIFILILAFGSAEYQGPA